MAKKYILLLASAASIAASAASDQRASLTIEGVVIRENGTPVAGVAIVAIERAPWSLVGPIADKKVARGISDTSGHFTIQIPRTTKIRRLSLGASGQWKRMNSREGDLGLMGTSVALERVAKEGN